MVLVFVVPQTTPVLGDLHVDCTVGFVGTAASVTVQGVLAGQSCQQILNGSKGTFGQPYALTVAPTQPVVCEFTQGMQTYMVRDEGLLKLVGNALCYAINKAHAAPTTFLPGGHNALFMIAMGQTTGVGSAPSRRGGAPR